MATSFKDFISRHNTVSLLKVTGVTLSSKGAIDKLELKNQFGEKLVTSVKQIVEVNPTSPFNIPNVEFVGKYVPGVDHNYNAVVIYSANHRYGTTIPVQCLPKTTAWSGTLQNPAETESCYTEYMKFAKYITTIIPTLCKVKELSSVRFFVYTPTNKDFNFPFAESCFHCWESKEKIYYTSRLAHYREGKIDVTDFHYAGDTSLIPKIPKNNKGDNVISAVFQFCWWGKSYGYRYNYVYMQVNYSLKTKNVVIRLMKSEEQEEKFIDQVDKGKILRGQNPAKVFDISALIKDSDLRSNFRTGKVVQYEVFNGNLTSLKDFIENTTSKIDNRNISLLKPVSSIPKFKLLQLILKGTEKLLSKYGYLTLDETSREKILAKSKDSSLRYIDASILTLDVLINGETKKYDFYNKEMFDLLKNPDKLEKCNNISFCLMLRIFKTFDVFENKPLPDEKREQIININICDFPSGYKPYISTYDTGVLPNKFMYDKFINAHRGLNFGERCSMKALAESMTELFNIWDQMFIPFKKEK